MESALIESMMLIEINSYTLSFKDINHTIAKMPVGERMGQLVFIHTVEVEGTYASGRKGMSGKYQTSNDLDELIANWKPADMLPKAYKDSRTMPENIPGLAKGTL